MIDAVVSADDDLDLPPVRHGHHVIMNDAPEMIDDSMRMRRKVFTLPVPV